MSVVIFLPLLLTEVSNNNFWVTMKQNKTKITKKENHNPKKKPKLLVHLVNKEELWAFNKSVIQK